MKSTESKKTRRLLKQAESVKCKHLKTPKKNNTKPQKSPRIFQQDTVIREILKFIHYIKSKGEKHQLHTITIQFNKHTQNECLEAVAGSIEDVVG